MSFLNAFWQGGVESMPSTNTSRSSDFFVSPSLLTSVDRFLDKIKNADVADVEELKVSTTRHVLITNRMAINRRYNIK